jgi:hypothetical protein
MSDFDERRKAHLQEADKGFLEVNAYELAEILSSGSTVAPVELPAPIDTTPRAIIIGPVKSKRDTRKFLADTLSSPKLHVLNIFFTTVYWILGLTVPVLYYGPAIIANIGIVLMIGAIISSIHLFVKVLDWIWP